MNVTPVKTETERDGQCLVVKSNNPLGYYRLSALGMIRTGYGFPIFNIQVHHEAADGRTSRAGINLDIPGALALRDELNAFLIEYEVR